MDTSEWYGLPQAVRSNLSNGFIDSLPSGVVAAIESKKEPVDLPKEQDIVVEAAARFGFMLAVSVVGAGIFFGGVGIAIAGALMGVDPLLWVGIFVAVAGFVATGAWVGKNDPMEHWKHRAAAMKAYNRAARSAGV